MSERGKLAGSVLRVLRLHRRKEWEHGNPRPIGALEHGVCAWCGTIYPCPTVEALEGGADE